MSGADGTCMDVALLDTQVAAAPAGRSRNVAHARREAREDRIEPIDHGRLAADHHAIAALDAPDAAGGPDIEIVDAALLQRLAAAHVVLPEGVAAIDDDVA